MHYKVYFKHDWQNILWERKVPFFSVFMVILFVTYAGLYALDLYPELRVATSTSPLVVSEAMTTTDTDATKVATAPEAKPDSENIDPLPMKLIIEKLDREVQVLNPKDNSVEALDAALLKGVARHPDSADFKKTGMMFLLGHSSYLPTVHNKNFQAFNGIQKLAWGDLIRVQSGDTEYLYRVQKAYEVKASRAEADITWGKAKLVMVTCNSFGSKDDRFVVEAFLIDSYPLAGAGKGE